MASKNQVVIDRVLRITSFSKTTGKALYMLTEVEDLGISITTEEKEAVDATGATVATFELGKKGTMSGSASFINFGLMAAQNGSDGVKATSGAPLNFPQYDEGTILAAGGTFNLSQEPVGIAGSQIKFIYALNNDGTLGQDYAQAATASATEFSYAKVTGTPDLFKITVPTAAAAGSRFAVFYEYAAKAGTRYDNNSDEYSSAAIIKVDVLAADICNPAALTVTTLQSNNAKLSSAYDITWSTDGKHPFEYKLDTAYCGTIGKGLFSVYVPE